MTTIHTVRRRLARFDAPAHLSDLNDDEFEGYASLFGVPDGAGDVVARGAFAATLRRRPPEKVRMLYQHFAHEPLGVWETIREDARGLYVKGRLVLDVLRAREVRSLIRDGALNGLSIGFRTQRATREAGHRVLNEIELWEISVVTFPLLAGSKVTAIGAKGLAHNIREAAHRIQTKTQLSSPASRTAFLPPFTGGVPPKAARGANTVLAPSASLTLSTSSVNGGGKRSLGRG